MAEARSDEFTSAQTAAQFESWFNPCSKNSLVGTDQKIDTLLRQPQFRAIRHYNCVSAQGLPAW